MDRRGAAYAGVSVLLLSGALVLSGSPWQSNDRFHTVLEVTATLLALFAGVIALVRFYTRKTNRFLFIGTAFLGTALLDGYHAVVTSSILADWFPSELPSLIPWSWIASRAFLSVLLWMSVLAWRREETRGEDGRLSEAAIYAGAGVMTVASFLFFAVVPLPRAYYPEVMFARPEDLVPGLFFLLAFVGYVQKGAWRREGFEHWLVLSLVVASLGQTAFMPFARANFDAMFDAAHALKIVSYVLVLAGLVVNIFEVYRRELEGNLEIQRASVALEVQIEERRRAEESLHGKAEELFESNRELARFTEALRESEQKFRTLFEHSRDAIYVSTLDGRIIESNESMRDLLGFTEEEIRDLDARELYVDLKDRARFRAEVETTGSVKEFPFKLRRNDGSIIDCLATSTVRLGPHGEVIGYQGIIRDITEQKRLEEQLLQSQKMEAVGLLAGGIAHDFNNLLTGITGYTQLLIGKTPDEPDLRKILEIVDRGAELTRQLLAFSRQQEMERKSLDLNQLVRTTSGMLARLISKEIEMEIIGAPDLRGVWVDGGKIEQVLINLTINARDAMPEGGKLTIETSNEDLDGEMCNRHEGLVPGAYVRLAITDTGHGMEETVTQQIFEPFFTTKEFGEGTGLGLATVYGIVKQHQGAILVDSEPDVGTRFTIFLPEAGEEPAVMPARGHGFAGRAARARTRPPAASEAGEAGTVLLVDDEEAVRLVAQRGLELHGYRVFQAASPSEAEELFSEHSDEISVLVTDVVMPEMDGPTLYQKLSGARASLKVLYMSGYAPTGVIDRKEITAGAPFLAKPFTPDQLVMEVGHLLEQGADS